MLGGSSAVCSGLHTSGLAQGNEFQLKELDTLRAEIAEKDALVVRLTQELRRVVEKNMHAGL